MIGLLRQNISIAQQNIKGQLLRTILTIIIIAIGITALVGILSAVNDLSSTLTNGISEIGTNTYYIQQYELSIERRGGNRRTVVNPIIKYRRIREFENKYKTA